MWVVRGERVAILAAIDEVTGVGELHYVNVKGETMERGYAKLGAVRMAKRAELPAARLKGTPEAVLKGFGYV
jgi:hypothetical protein